MTVKFLPRLKVWLCGRVLYAMPCPATLSEKCADCGQPAVYVMNELTGETWYYCGVCEVG